MSSDQFILIVHILAATVWIGGNMFLTISYVPKALKTISPTFIDSFSKYEPFGIPALIISLITGLIMANNRGMLSLLFTFSNPLEKAISIKLLLFIIVSILILVAKFTFIPKIKSQNVKKQKITAYYILSLTFIGVIFVILATYLRFGGI